MTGTDTIFLLPVAGGLRVQYFKLTAEREKGRSLLSLPESIMETCSVVLTFTFVDEIL